MRTRLYSSAPPGVILQEREVRPSATCNHPVYLVSIDYEKFLGKWWIVRATASVFHEGEQCAHFTVNRKAEQLYNMTAEFRIVNGRTRRLSLDLADDENPAQYTASLNDKPLIWATILGTDYENWAVVNIREGTYVSTVVASRKPTLDPDFHKTVQSIAEKNKIMQDFRGVLTEECRDSI
nr:uncharacterized protein LOC126524725 [Dermacentor andersoni]